MIPMKMKITPNAGNDDWQFFPTIIPKIRTPPFTFSIFTVGGGHCWPNPVHVSSSSIATTAVSLWKGEYNVPTSILCDLCCWNFLSPYSIFWERYSQEINWPI